MAFFRIQSQHHLANTPDACKVSLCRLAGRVKGTGAVGLRIAMGVNVLETLGAKAGDKLDLLWGRDGDAGKVLLIKAERGVSVKKTRESKHDAGYLTFVNLPKEPVPGIRPGDRWTFGAKPRPAVSVDWAAGNGGVTVTLPEDWWTVAISEARQATQNLTRVPMPVARIA